MTDTWFPGAVALLIVVCGALGLWGWRKWTTDRRRDRRDDRRDKP